MEPVWPVLVVPCAVALAQMVNDRRWSGEAGRQRLLALEPSAARDVRDAYAPLERGPRTRRRRAVLRGAAVVAAAGYVAGVYLWWDWVGAVLAGSAVVLGIATAVSRDRVRPHVLAVLAERDDIATREVSKRGRRRSRQVLVAAGVAVVGATVAGWGAERWEQPVLWVVMGAFAVAFVVLLLGAAWAGSWRYGDEEPA